MVQIQSTAKGNVMIRRIPPQRELGDGSDPAYGRGEGDHPANPTNGSWGMVQFQPTARPGKLLAAPSLPSR